MPAATLLLVCGLAHAAIGLGGIAGLATFEANVAEIDDAVPGGLFGSLAAWGMLLLVLGVGEVLSALAIRSGSQNGVLAGQIAAFCGLGAAFFTLAIFRVPVLLTIPIGLLAAHLLGRAASD